MIRCACFVWSSTRTVCWHWRIINRRSGASQRDERDPISLSESDMLITVFSCGCVCVWCVCDSCNSSSLFCGCTVVCVWTSPVPSVTAQILSEPLRASESVPAGSPSWSFNYRLQFRTVVTGIRESLRLWCFRMKACVQNDSSELNHSQNAPWALADQSLWDHKMIN